MRLLYCKKMTVFNITYNKRIPQTTKIELDYEIINETNVGEVASLRNNTYLKEYNYLIKSKKAIGIACYNKNEAIGYVWAKFPCCRDKLIKIRNSVYLSSSFVKEEYRGNNIHACLITKLMDEVEKNNTSKTENLYSAAIYETNKASLKGAEKVGFEYVKTIKLVRFLKMTFFKQSV